MAFDLPPRVFITGTDTGVGKTVISAMIVAGTGAEYWKPVQCGTDETTDREWVIRSAGVPPSRTYKEAYLLKHPLSPHAAARCEGVTIDLGAITLPPSSPSRSLVVEGAGGIMVPLNDRHYMVDLMKRLKLPVLLVASSRLGTINHTLLSLEQLRRHGLEILGVVVNGHRNLSNRDAIRGYGGVAILAEVEPLQRIDPNTLKKAFEQAFLKRG